MIVAAKVCPGVKGYGCIHNAKAYFMHNDPDVYTINDTEEYKTGYVMMLLAGYAAVELVYGEKHCGSDKDLLDVKKSIIDDLIYHGKYGLEFIKITDSIEQQNKIDRKAHELIEELYKKTIEILKPYKSLLEQIGDRMVREGYILLPDVKLLIEEYDKNRDL